MECYKALTSSTTILDIGGNGHFWRLVQRLGLPFPARVTVLNLYERDERLPNRVEWKIGDARRIAYPDRTFDVAFSKSVIEHVGSFSDQMAMASETHRVARS